LAALIVITVTASGAIPHCRNPWMNLGS